MRVPLTQRANLCGERRAKICKDFLKVGSSKHQSGWQSAALESLEKSAPPPTPRVNGPPGGHGCRWMPTTPGISERRAVVRLIGKYAGLAPYFGSPIKPSKAHLTSKCQRREWKIVELYRVGRCSRSDRRTGDCGSGERRSTRAVSRSGGCRLTTRRF